jgi:hypothetical protein
MRARSRTHHVTLRVFLSLSTQCFATQRSGVGVRHIRFCEEVDNNCGEHVWTTTSVASRPGSFAPYLKLKYQEGETTKLPIILLNCILGCPVSNPGTGLIDRVFRSFLTAARQMPGQCLKIGHGSILSDPYQLIINILKFNDVWSE